MMKSLLTCFLCALTATSASVWAQEPAPMGGSPSATQDASAAHYHKLLKRFQAGDHDVPFLKEFALSALSLPEPEGASRAYDITRDLVSQLTPPFTKDDWKIIAAGTRSVKDLGFTLIHERLSEANNALGPDYAQNKVLAAIMASEIDPEYRAKGPATDWDQLAERLTRTYGSAGRLATYVWAMSASAGRGDWKAYGKYFIAYYADPKDEYVTNLINEDAWTVFQKVDDPRVVEAAIRAQKYALDTHQGGGRAGSHYLFLSPNDGAQARAGICDTDLFYGEGVAASAIPARGSETHVAVVVNNRTIALYVNGVLAKQVPLTSQKLAALSSEHAFIGASSYPNDPDFTGAINELRLYSVAATPEQIAASFRAGPNQVATELKRAKGSAPLIHRYSFNDGTARDLVGHADGKLVGGVRIVEGQARFDGAADERIELPAHGPNGINIDKLSALTVEAWYTDQGTRRNGRIFDFGATITPDDPNAIDTYAELLYKAGRTAEAIEWEEKALAEAHGGQNAGLYSAALALMKDGKPLPTS